MGIAGAMGRPIKVNREGILAAWFRKDMTAPAIAERFNTSKAYVHVLWQRAKAAGALPDCTRAEYLPVVGALRPSPAAPPAPIVADRSPDALDPELTVEDLRPGCFVPVGDPLLAALKAAPEGRAKARKADDMSATLARAGKPAALPTDPELLPFVLRARRT